MQEEEAEAVEEEVGEGGGRGREQEGLKEQEERDPMLRSVAGRRGRQPGARGEGGGGKGAEAILIRQEQNC